MLCVTHTHHTHIHTHTRTHAHAHTHAHTHTHAYTNKYDTVVGFLVVVINITEKDGLRKAKGVVRSASLRHCSELLRVVLFDAPSHVLRRVAMSHLDENVKRVRSDISL